GRLVHRALQVMGDCSPAYLEHFLAYVDVLAWLEPLSQPQGEAAAAAQHRRKPARKPRAPRAKRRPQGSPGTSTDQPSRSGATSSTIFIASQPLAYSAPGRMVSSIIAAVSSAVSMV